MSVQERVLGSVLVEAVKVTPQVGAARVEAAKVALQKMQSGFRTISNFNEFQILISRGFPSAIAFASQTFICLEKFVCAAKLRPQAPHIYGRSFEWMRL